MKPGGKRRVATKFGQTAMGADEGVLCDLLGVRLVVERLVGQRPDAWIIAFDDFGESGLIPAIKALDQHGVVRGFEFVIGPNGCLTVVLNCGALWSDT